MQICHISYGQCKTCTDKISCWRWYSSSFAAFVLHVPLNMDVIKIPHIVVLGAVCFGTSLYFFLISMKRIGIVRSVISLSSVFGLIFASLFLGELISTQQIIAVVVMLAGIYLINIEKENAKRGNIITSIEETDFKDK